MSDAPNGEGRKTAHLIRGAKLTHLLSEEGAVKAAVLVVGVAAQRIKGAPAGHSGSQAVPLALALRIVGEEGQAAWRERLRFLQRWRRQVKMVQVSTRLKVPGKLPCGL